MKISEMLMKLESSTSQNFTISVTRSGARNFPEFHRRRGIYTASAGNVFGYGDTPEAAMENALVNAIRFDP